MYYIHISVGRSGKASSLTRLSNEGPFIETILYSFWISFENVDAFQADLYKIMSNTGKKKKKKPKSIKFGCILFIVQEVSGT